MCGIVGYIGEKEAGPILLGGLKKLEYRGYDSAGVAILSGNTTQIRKKEGKVSVLENLLTEEPVPGTVGIAHTRWATHGVPSDTNAHPHTSGDGAVTLVHNGIIENYRALREELSRRGHTWKSETDTEVLAHLIGHIYRKGAIPLEEAVRQALTQVRGAYAIAVVSPFQPDVLVAARKGSPLVIGVGEGEFFVASDATPLIEYTKEVIYLGEQEVACISRNSGVSVVSLQNESVEPFIQELSLSLEAIEKGGFDYFMLKEIYDQPEAIRNCLRGRFNEKDGSVMLGGICDYESLLKDAKRITIVACGTSLYAGMVGKRYVEEFARIPVEVEQASEFRYRNPILGKGDVVLAISQSGETADTLAALRLAKERGALTLGITNVVGSSVARETDAGVYTHAGPEIGVASTKAFTAQISVLLLLALRLGTLRETVDEVRRKEVAAQLFRIPELIEKQLLLANDIKVVAEKYASAEHALFLGRGYGVPLALEGALKLKEISYIHAEGYAAGEMKHGPIALIDEKMPVIVIAPRGQQFEKIMSGVSEAKARGGKIILLTNEKGSETELADDILQIADVEDVLVPLVATIPLQLFAYYAALARGTNVDQPRNLAKSVTVE